MGIFTESELQAIANARCTYPAESQRKLAARIYRNAHLPLGETLRRRSQQSIYSALRRHDASQGAERAAEIVQSSAA